MDCPHENRNYNIHSLGNYLEDYCFGDFEKSVKPAIEDLEKQIAVILDKLAKCNEDSNEQMFLSYDLNDLDDRLCSIYEMAIIDAYKEFELVLKRLIKVTFESDSSGLYKWEKTKDFLKTKNIYLSNAKNYNEMNSLRILNNYLKHGEKHNIPANIRAITEFSDNNLRRISAEELKLFYHRIKDLRIHFILDLKEKIFSHLYVFDDTRIESIATQFQNVMNKNDAEKLILKLKDLYDL